MNNFTFLYLGFKGWEFTIIIKLLTMIEFCFVLFCFVRILGNPQPGLVIIIFLSQTIFRLVFFLKISVLRKFYPIVMFVVYVGGILVVLVYLVRLTRSRKLKTKKHKWLWLLGLLTLAPHWIFFSGFEIFLGKDCMFWGLNIFLFKYSILFISTTICLLSIFFKTQKSPIRFLKK